MSDTRDGNATAGRRILLVGAASATQQSVAASIVIHADVCIERAESAAQAVQLLLTQSFDAVLVDAPLPDMSGVEVCRRVRQQNIHVPIVVLGPGSEPDELEAFECGANDYVVRPPSVPVLLARLRAHMRQHDERDGAEFALGAYVFRSSARMPVLAQAVKDAIESTSQFAQRRLDWARKICASEGRRPSYSEFRAMVGSRETYKEPFASKCREAYRNL